MRFAELMDFYLEACSDRKQVTDHLEDLLSSFPEKSIIDCSVGTGFITLDLISQGYGIVCTDGSAGMLEQFERNAAELGLEANPVLLDWADLAGTFPDMFDLLICRGNSLVYANVWDDNTAAAGASSIAGHLKSMYGALKPGGFIYVDIPAAPSEERSSGRISHVPCEIRGRQVTVTESIADIPESEIRRWDVRMEIDDEVFEFTRHSHMYGESRLREALEQAGFVEIMPLEGNTLREHYQVFTARKPLGNVMQRFAQPAGASPACL
ncbi:class I SAM-dependent methyltransferase [Streptomyces sp. NPDC056491]|uniref:class I SAM-dependent methyltransferase n=1 Tax=Streptomyces sp. NPDC056491 TaxID=3345837 RepID=UPI0036B99AEB